MPCLLTRRTLLTAGAALTTSPLALAQNGRNAQRLLVGFPPGGAADILARALAPTLQAGGTNYIVENKPGAGGRLAVLETKRSPADGHTVLITADPILTIYPYVFKKLNYEPNADLVPVAPIASEPMGLIIGPMVPADVKTLAEFITWCKQNPREASYATAAAGTTMHFLGSMLAQAANFEFTHIPHRGAAAGVQDVLGGQIASTIVTMSQVAPLMGTGKLRVLAVSSKARMNRLPEVPSFVELGYTQIESIVYYGAYVRSGTPAAQVQRLSSAIQAAGQQADMRATIGKMGVDSFFLPPDRFATFFKADYERWGPIIKATGYQVDD